MVGWTQVPLPSHAPTGLLIDPLQLAVPQLVPTAAFAHWPSLPQVPLLPQGKLALAPQPPCGSRLPAATL